MNHFNTLRDVGLINYEGAIIASSFTIISLALLRMGKEILEVKQRGANKWGNVEQKKVLDARNRSGVQH